ncbi:involucrin repeat protein [Cordyceps fumosorosea ARSEF 2679]|uniref:Involucrin repeat protein n=1 Tax=Cordyceps fumosorosea (strain ARSEF 2679) TaxID=1081104 RepID=A0A167SB28_CORFA|nr:involucrin repeat protein [Cordyceps fumosorosea ARSEF 2679]OAA59441.1 involucrin repeat protein [Cordyceps fumosorosea ARSEF 2679]
MNGVASGRSPFDYGASNLSPVGGGRLVGGKAAVDEFARNMLVGEDRDASRYPQINRTPSPAVVDLKDPIQIHLLTETALADSNKYEILPQEEVDNLKKQSQLMMQRIESTRANLAIQAKYRDAALSMAKLSPDGSQDPQAEQDGAESQRKCEELALELFNLEKSLMIPQRRILEHTAGILQITHKASKKKNAQQSQVVNGIPGSPESLYTYSHSRNSLDAAGDDTYFEDGMYPLDSAGRKNAIEIPMKSPNRERGEMDRVKEENLILIRSVSDFEEKLRALNGSLRDTIVRFSPDVNKDYIEPPRNTSNSKPLEMLRQQLDYLETGLVAVQAEQESSSQTGPSDGAESDETVRHLWGVIQNDFAGTRQRREERRRARVDKGLSENDEDEGSDDEFDHSEAYNIKSFTKRVNYLSSQTATLKDQRTVLKRQIKQQRELNNKSDAEKDEELARRQEEIESARQAVARAERDAMDAQNMLSEALQDLEQARALATSAGTAQSDLRDREETIELLEKKIKKVEAEGKRSGELTAELERAVAEKQAAEAAAEALQADAKQKDKLLKNKENDVDELNMTIAELKTEVTIARAELDGAYGTRAERAADVAALKNNAEVQKLSNQIEKLKKELAGTAEDLESITKETLGAEREKLELEGKLDEALQARQQAEVGVEKAREQIATLQEELDGHRLRVGGGKGGGAGASMLSEQFRATMREERKKFQEDLREERGRARKLEEELARLKRSQGPGKSPLSPR